VKNGILFAKDAGTVVRPIKKSVINGFIMACAPILNILEMEKPNVIFMNIVTGRISVMGGRACLQNMCLNVHPIALIIKLSKKDT
jgi:hypothetical protein